MTATTANPNPSVIENKEKLANLIEAGEIQLAYQLNKSQRIIPEEQIFESQNCKYLMLARLIVRHFNKRIDCLTTSRYGDKEAQAYREAEDKGLYLLEKSCTQNNNFYNGEIYVKFKNSIIDRISYERGRVSIELHELNFLTTNNNTKAYWDLGYLSQEIKEAETVFNSNVDKLLITFDEELPF